MITILVCFKPIRTSCLSNESVNSNEMRLNPYDIPTIKNAIQIKKQIQDCRVICLSMGVEQTAKILNRCLAMGADQAFLLNDPRFAASDTYATSYILSEAIKKIGNVDIIVCGAKSLDGETGQVPVGIASRLKMAYIPHIQEMAELSKRHVIVNTINSARREKIRAQLPLVAIFDRFELAEPTVNLFSLKRSQHLQQIIWDADDLQVDYAQIGQGGSKTRVISVKSAARAGEAKIIEGTVDVKSIYLHNILIRDSAAASL